MSDDPKPEPDPSAETRLRWATAAEHDLIDWLATNVAMFMLRKWDQVPQADRALTMNRAFLSALAHAAGTLLGAMAATDPANEVGWRGLVDVSVEMLQKSAEDHRRQALAAAPQTPGEAPAAADPAYVFPEPKTVM